MTNKKIYERIIERERLARKEAESIMEVKSLELYDTNKRLLTLNADLEKEVSRRTQKIKERESQLNVLFDGHPFPIIVYELSEKKIVAVNETALNKYGFTRSEFLDKTIYELHPEKEHDRLKKHIDLMQIQKTTVQEWLHFDKAGNIFNVVIKGNSISYGSKDARLIVVEDITERKKLELERVRQNRKYQDLIESSSDIIFRMNTEGFFTYVNPAAVKLSGFSSEELLTMSFAELVAPKYKQRVINFYQFQMQNKLETTYTEFPIVTKDNREIWLGQNVESSADTQAEELVFNATARDITERKKLEKALLRSEEKYRSIIENMEMGLVEVDPKGMIIKAYPRFCQLTGYTQTELEGQMGADFLLDEEGRKFYNKQLLERENGKSNVYEIELIRKDGVKVWVLVSGAPFYDEYNRFKGSFGIHLDITERKKLESELKTAKESAENSLKSKELFMANISHEIRTPLNAIIGITELLNIGTTDPENIKQLNHIGQAGKGLLSLINELLLLSKLDAYKERIDLQEVNLYSFVQQNFELFENQARKKPINYTAEINVNESAYYWLDPIKLGQIIQNILSNAIKFTDQGEVKLSVNVLNNSYDNDVIQFIISDTGIGIPPQNIDTIFNIFEQASNNESGTFGGTGLGLPIVKKLLELMEGEINVVSENGNTSFEFFLNLNRSSNSGATDALNTAEVSFKDFSGVKVLVAEDNKVNQFLIEGYLKHLNIDFNIVNNGEEAIQYLKTNKVDAVIMDMRMPVMNGLEATKIIRNELGMKNLPILAFTANAYNTHQKECKDAGMNDFLAKPFNISQLQNVLIKNLNIESNHRIPSPSPQDEADLPVSLQIKLDRIFIEDTEARIIELEHAASSGNQQVLKDLCHSLRPSLLHLKQAEIIETTNQIEFGTSDILSKTDILVGQLKLLIQEMKSNLPDVPI